MNDLQSDPLLRERYFPRAEMDPAADAPQLSVLAAELTLDGQAIGVINVEATPDNRFDQSHLDFVNAVARQISMAITHAALFDEDNFRTATDSLLVEATSRDSDAGHASSPRSHPERPELADLREAGRRGYPLRRPARQRSPWSSPTAPTARTSGCGWISAQASAARHSAIGKDRPAAAGVSSAANYRPVVQGMRCEMATPIIFGGSNRFPIGVLNLESSRENAFSNVGTGPGRAVHSGEMVNAVAMTKLRADIDSELQDQLVVLAADQVLNAVHRINNHVGSIRVMAHDLLEDLDSPSPLDPGELAHRLRMIESNADHALEIPNELRKRIGTPQESVDVNAQVEAGLAAVRIPKHIELVTDLAPGLPNIPCTALDLVVENLLLNAVKAMQDRPGTLRVTSRLDERLPREPFIVITVQDTGVGMTEDELGRLFEPRQAGHRGGGLGFGMMWVRSWVRRAQGLIEVDSQPGSGTTVNIRFQIDTTADRSNAPGRRADVKAPTRALVVEDIEAWVIHPQQSRATSRRLRGRRLREPADGQGRAAERQIRRRDPGCRP